MGLGRQGEQVDQGVPGTRRMSIDVIKDMDNQAKDIIDGSDHVDVFSLNEETGQWKRSFGDAELLIYSRNVDPSYVLLVDYFFDVPLTAQKKIKIESPVIFYKNELNRVRCFRFKSKDECNRIGELVKKIIQPMQLNSQQPKSQPGIFSLLAKAQEDFDKYIADDHVAQPPSKHFKASNEGTATNLNLLDFFSAVKAKPPPVTDIPNFNKMLSQTVSVDQIEKQQRRMVPGYFSPHVVEAIKRIRLSGPSSKPSQSLDLCKSSTSLKNVGTDDQSAIQTNPKLLTPMVFSATKNATPLLLPLPKEPSSTGGASDTTNRSEGFGRSEPLTNNQMLQAISYLMKTDKEFVAKLHEAYLHSFKETLA